MKQKTMKKIDLFLTVFFVSILIVFGFSIYQTARLAWVASHLTDKDLPPNYTVVCDGNGHFGFRDPSGSVWVVRDKRWEVIYLAILDYKRTQGLEKEPKRPPEKGANE